MDELSVSIDSAKQAFILRYQAIGLLARREQSRSELQRKLHLRMLKKGWDVDLEYLLDELYCQGLQSDVRFSEVLIRSKANAGYGPSRLYQWGVQYGLDRKLVQLQMQEQQFDWFANALKQKRKHCGSSPAVNLKERAKQARYLYQRGFAQDEIYYAIDALPDDRP